MVYRKVTIIENGRWKGLANWASQEGQDARIVNCREGEKLYAK